MQRLDRRSFLLRGAALATSIAGWQLIANADGAVDPRLVALQRLVKGPVLVPSSAGYAQARLIYQERYDSVYPLGVVQPLSVGDVREIIAWSTREKVPFAIRSGGHSYGGYSTTTGLVIDLRRFNAIVLDSATGRVSVGAGARLIDIESTLASAGRAIPSGSCATVGIGGLALGGGVGFAARRFGTTSDNIVSLGIVTADGRLRTCSATQNPELYWACRGGGGGNFGVVTHFDLQSHPVGDVSFFFATWPWSQASEVAAAWQHFAPYAPDELFSLCSFRTGTTGPVIECFGQYLGAQSKLASLLKPLAAVSGAQLTLGSSSYIDAQLRWAGCLGRTVDQCHLVGDTPGGDPQPGQFLCEVRLHQHAALGRRVRDDHTVVRARPERRFRLGGLLLDSYGGAINRVAADATAFVHRNALCSGQYIAHWSKSSTAAAAKAWLVAFYAAMRPYVSGFAYQNYIDPGLASWKHAYYGTNYPRLQTIKSQVDPGWLFRFAQGITPV